MEILRPLLYEVSQNSILKISETLSTDVYMKSVLFAKEIQYRPWIIQPWKPDRVGKVIAQSLGSNLFHIFSVQSLKCDLLKYKQIIDLQIPLTIFLSRSGHNKPLGESFVQSPCQPEPLEYVKDNLYSLPECCHVVEKLIYYSLDVFYLLFLLVLQALYKRFHEYIIRVYVNSLMKCVNINNWAVIQAVIQDFHVTKLIMTKENFF